MKNITLGIVSLAVAAAIIGAYFFPVAGTTLQTIIGGTTQGATFNTAHQASVAGVALSSPGSNATSSSVQNTTGQDLYITAVKAGCETVGSSNTAYTGTGLAQLKFTAATTSTSNPVALGNTNKIGGGDFVIGTSTAWFALSSSTASSNNGNNSLYVIWPASTYVTFTTNATNTAVCTFGVDYFSS